MKQLKTVQVVGWIVGLLALQSVAADQAAPPASPSAASSETTTTDVFSSVRLLGTVLRNNPAADAVVAEDVATGKQHIYRLGEPFYGGILQAINRGSITVAVGDQRYLLVLPEGPVGLQPMPQSDQGIHRPTGSARRHTRSLLPSAPLRPGDLEPYVEGGAVTGARIRKLPAIGARRRAGLKRGDIIRRVDGEPITSADVVQQLPQRLRQHALATFEVERRGHRVELVYHHTR